ncbi:MAG TPA: fused MFS/spermidine synthase, partial [Isosphaeraceae bacterium]
GVLLGGLSLGNLIGGKIADFVRQEKQASWLFLVASVLTISILLAETPPSWISALVGDTGAVLSRAITLSGHEWWARVLFVVTLVFFLPAVAMGTVSPVVAKLAVDRLRRSKRTGTAIGQVYAWGMVGSILGTFLTGFVLIDVLGTKGVVLALGTALALAATTLGTVWHAAWAGIPLGLCVIALVPSPWFRAQALAWGIREERGNPRTEKDELAWVDESNYYFIKVSNEPDEIYDGPHPGPAQKRTLVLDNLIHGYFTLGHPERIEYDYEFIYAQVGYRAFQDRLRAAGGAGAGAKARPLSVLFLGGGSYTFPRYLQATYPGTACDVAEIDPAITETNHIALGLPRDTPIRTIWGDARQFVEKAQGRQKYDLVFGDAFNDFSVPWHLTTREFNEKIARLLTDDGVYMINIIDVYKKERSAELDAATAAKALRQGKEPVADQGDDALKYGGFIGSWVETARQTFPHVYVFGTDKTPGSGLRETFVVVASKRPLDLQDIGRREGDPRFDQDGENFEPAPFSDEHMQALKKRSRGIILTDDYAPVENLLAPVAATRGD